MNIPSSDPVVVKGVDGNIHTNGLAKCHAESSEYSNAVGVAEK